jgi:CubicO group peptidase (beta-lactamase class C family)
MEIGHRPPEGASQPPAAGQANGASVPINELDLKLKVAEVLDRRPSAGLVVVLVRDGSVEWLLGQGVADAESNEPITEDTVFRIGSITKTFTAIAVMQLCEQGRTVTRLLTDTFSFQKRPDARNPRRLVGGTLLAGATTIAVRQCRGRQRLRALIPAHPRSP